jgi:hypothetical protein
LLRQFLGEPFVIQAALDAAALRAALEFMCPAACVQNRCFCHTANLSPQCEADDGRLSREDATERLLLALRSLPRARRFQLAQVRAGRFVDARNGFHQ